MRSGHLLGVAAAALDIDAILDALKSSMERTISEDELLRIVSEQLTMLRASFAPHRELFTPSRVQFLKYVASISDHLRAFVQLKDELAYVGTLEEYASAVRLLTEIKDRLAPFAVSRRVAKNLRELSEMAPTIRAQHEANRRFRIEAKMLDLERDAPDCKRGHAMVIRMGQPGNFFWGCSQYPFCAETVELTVQQKAALAADGNARQRK